MHTEPSEAPIAIVGMGPGGMAAALECAKKGKKVIIFDNRDNFSRVQKVILTTDTTNFLVELKEKCNDIPGYRNSLQYQKDREFLAPLLNNPPLPPQIADLQEYLKNKMQILYPDLITIKQGRHIKIEDVDPQTFQIQYKEGDISHAIEFKHLVAADGARHGIADLLKIKSPTLPIEYRRLGAQLRHAANGTVNVEIQAGVATKNRINEPWTLKNFPEAFAKLQVLGWDKPHLPSVYIWPDQTKRNFYIAGEIPSNFVSLTPEERTLKMKEYAQVLLMAQYGYNETDIVLNQHVSDDPKQAIADKERISMMATAFNVELNYVNQSAIALDDKHSFVQLGDAARNPNFYLGHGTNDAISDAIFLAENIQDDGTINVANYNEEHQYRVELNNARTDSLLARYEFELEDSERYFSVELQKQIELLKVEVTELLPAGFKNRVLRDFKSLDKIPAKDLELKFKQLQQVCNNVLEYAAKNHNLYDKLLKVFARRITFVARILEKRQKQREVIMNKFDTNTSQVIKSMSYMQEAHRLKDIMENRPKVEKPKAREPKVLAVKASKAAPQKNQENINPTVQGNNVDSPMPLTSGKPGLNKLPPHLVGRKLPAPPQAIVSKPKPSTQVSISNSSRKTGEILFSNPTQVETKVLMPSNSLPALKELFPMILEGLIKLKETSNAGQKHELTLYVNQLSKIAVNPVLKTDRERLSEAHKFLKEKANQPPVSAFKNKIQKLLTDLQVEPALMESAKNIPNVKKPH